jgi:hypothetical protein
MNLDFVEYNNKLIESDKLIGDLIANTIDTNLQKFESKIWHGHPVWFLDGNPVVGYSKTKKSIRILFWSGQSFDEEILVNNGTFKAAQIDYTNIDQINIKDLIRLLKKATLIQWDYKNIVKRKGELLRLK